MRADTPASRAALRQAPRVRAGGRAPRRRHGSRCGRRRARPSRSPGRGCRAPVHQEQGDGAGTGWHPAREARDVHEAGDHIPALSGRRTARDQEPGEVPVGRPHPARETLIRQRMPGPRADQIEPERADDLLANLGGFRQTSHVTSRPAPIPCIDFLNGTISGEATGNARIGGPSWLCPTATLCSPEKGLGRRCGPNGNCDRWTRRS